MQTVVRSAITAAMLAVTLLSASAAWGQGITIDARVDRQRITEGERLTLTIQVQFQGRTRVSARYPEGGSFRVVGSTQFQTSVGGWGQDATTQFNQVLQLQPLRTGTLTVGPVPVMIGGSAYTTEPIAVEVIPRAPASPPMAQPGPPAPSWPPPLPPRSAPPSAPPAPSVGPQVPVTPLPSIPRPTPGGGALPDHVDSLTPFVVANPARGRVYTGQQFVVDYEFYEPARRDWELLGMRQPSFENAWFEQVPSDLATDYVRGDQRVGRSVFSRRLVARYIVVPLEPGRLTIPPLEVEAAPQRYGSRLALVSSPVDVEVLELPEGAPAGFSRNNVGDYQFMVEIEEGGLRVGDPIRVTMRVEGTGLVNLVDLPPVSVPGANVQPPVEQREQRLEAGAIRGYKSIETVVIPIREGELRLGPFAFDYFDPINAIYRTVEDEGVTLTISGFSPSADLFAGGQEEEEAGLLDMLAPPRDSRDRGSEPLRLPGPLFWGLALLPAALFLASGMLQRARDRRQRSAPSRRKRSALSRARKALRQAKRADQTEGFREIAAAVRSYLRERFEIKAGALTSDQTRGVLLDRGFPEDLADEVSELLERCEVARFNQAADENGLLADVVGRADAALKSLESQG